MLLQLLLALGASCLFHRPSAATPLLSEHCGIDDGAALAQAFTRVHQSPGSDADAAPPWKHFADVAREMRLRWKKHKERQGHNVTKEHRAKVGNGTMLRNHPKKSGPPQALPEALSRVDVPTRNLQKMGEPLTVVVEDSLGRNFGFKIYSKSRMAVLFHALSRKLHIPMEEITLTWKGTAVARENTPVDLGVVEQDVFNVDSPTLQQEKVTKHAEARTAAKWANLKAEVEEAELKTKLERSRKRLANARRVAREQREQRREHLLKKSGMITLKFANVRGKQISMAYKKENWLGPLASLVSKRFDLDSSRVTLVSPDGKTISPHDTIEGLRLRDNDVIQVKYY